MLDDAPRDAQGRYTDPITGEQWIDSEAGAWTALSEDAQAVRDFYFEEYKEKGADALRCDLIESIWSENKKGQGVEIVNTSGEYYSGKRISNDNPFYAGVYQEYGRKPTKKEVSTRQFHYF